MHTSGLVHELHAIFGHTIHARPAMPSAKDRYLRVRLIAEELKEFADAIGVAFTYNLPDFESAVTPATLLSKDAVVQAADALGDLDVVVSGSFVAFGMDAEAIATEIHASNLSKLDASGKPIYDVGGKFLKGPNYTPPRLARVLLRQVEGMNAELPHSEYTLSLDELRALAERELSDHLKRVVR